MPTTARDLCIFALKEAGPLGVGQTPLAEDINDSFTLLSRMLAQWQRKRWLVPALMDISMFGNGEISNKIGPGQYYNAPRPDKIQSAYVVQVNTGGLKVSIPLRQIFSYEDYSRIAVKELASLPNYFFYDAAFPYGNVYAWPIANSMYEIHLIIKSLIGFNTGIQSIMFISTGANYQNGNYANIPLLNVPGLRSRSGSGSGATATLAIFAGQIIGCTIDNPGNGYTINDVLTVDTSYIGNVGTGFTVKISEVTSSLDSEFTLPPEYEEAIHYNLAIRICSAWQLSPQQSTVTLAKVALNTIKTANLQVPTMGMPNTLSQPRAYNIYSDYGY